MSSARQPNPSPLRFADQPVLGSIAEMPRRYRALQRWISAQGLPRVGRGRTMLRTCAQEEQRRSQLVLAEELREDLASYFAPSEAPPDRGAGRSPRWRRDLALQTNLLAVRQRHERRILRCAARQARGLAQQEWICWTLRRLDAAGELTEELLASSEGTQARALVVIDASGPVIGGMSPPAGANAALNASHLETFRGLVEQEVGLADGLSYLDYLDGADLSLRRYFD
jgi:hypothetical protein